ncbi:MAG: hypothetical protein FWD53_04505, partial [Phycisphaerales bacterium]|nr:hypothetical protein [Phycisphaerales bacterium]
NVYGYGMCCCASSNLSGLGRYIGLPAQGRMITAHSVSELWYDGAWHLFDPSLMNYFRNADGKVASVNEIHQSIRQWRSENPGVAVGDAALKEFGKNGGWKNGPKVLATAEPGMYSDTAPGGANGAGWHGWWSTMGEYGKISTAENALGYHPDFSGKKNTGVFDYGAQMGYKVNVQLRDGEKITRNWDHKGLHGMMKSGGKLPGAFDTKNAGRFLSYQRNYQGDRAPGRAGNGVQEYDVPLANGAFRGGALLADNLQSKSEGAAAAVAVKDASKEGTLIIRKPSSYLYMTGNIDMAPVVAAGGSITVFYSENHGLDWKEIAKFEQSGDQKLDITNNMFGRYDYQIKFVMQGAGTGLNSLKFTEDIQHSQAVLPLILEGDNKMTFTSGNEGTVTFEGNMKNEGSNLHMISFKPVLDGLADKMLQGNGTATFTMKTPGDITRFRMNAHYRARDYPAAYTDPNGRIRDVYRVDLSFDNGQTWKEATRLDRGQPAVSKYVEFSDVKPNSREMQVRFTGAQANTLCIFDMRLDADYKEPTGGFKPVKITYVWTENGQEKTHSHIATKPTDTWTIKCGPGTVAKSYTMELAK